MMKTWMKLGLVLALLVGLAAVILSTRRMRYLMSDELERVAIDTEARLAAYERSDDPADLRRWILSHDAGGATETYLVLSKWSQTHQRQFVNLAESFRGKDRDLFVEGFAFTLGDSGSSVAFETAFSNYQSPVLHEILRRAGSPVPKEGN